MSILSCFYHFLKILVTISPDVFAATDAFYVRTSTEPRMRRRKCNLRGSPLDKKNTKHFYGDKKVVANEVNAGGVLLSTVAAVLYFHLTSFF
jgi:hypothetical protein